MELLGTCLIRANKGAIILYYCRFYGYANMQEKQMMFILNTNLYLKTNILSENCPIKYNLLYFMKV